MSDWKHRAVEAAQGTHTGAILACVLQLKVRAPCFQGRATITSDGFVMCDFVDQNGQYRHGALVGDVGDLERNILLLAEHLSLDTAARDELCETIKQWIATDYRAKPGLFQAD